VPPLAVRHMLSGVSFCTLVVTTSAASPAGGAATAVAGIDTVSAIPSPTANDHLRILLIMDSPHVDNVPGVGTGALPQHGQDET
jgi:hypothetical protein